MKADIKEREEYAKRLKAEQKNLGFSNSELAAAAEVCLATAGKYLSGNSYPSADKRKLISDFIESRRFVKSFRAMEKEDFLEFLNELINTFKPKQTDIAKFTEIPQSHISDYFNGNPNRQITPKTQYDILSFFLLRAHIGADRRFLPEYEEIGTRLSEKLGINLLPDNSEIIYTSPDPNDANPFLKEYILRMKSNCQKRNAATIEMFENLPTAVKHIIQKHQDAFFYLERYEDSNGYYSCNSIIHLFNKMKRSEREKWLASFENYPQSYLRLDYRNRHSETILSFYGMMSECRRLPQLLNEKHRKQSDDKKLNDWFRGKVMNEFQHKGFNPLYFEFKLQMNYKDWYILFLIFLYQCKGGLIQDIFK